MRYLLIAIVLLSGCASVFEEPAYEPWECNKMHSGCQ